MFDLLLACGHHLLIFALAAILAFEIGVVRSDMTALDVVRVAKVDIWYGVLAAAILALGFCRAIFAAKGWPYYSTNLFFWAKIGALAAVGLLSIAPTVALIRWRRAGVPTTTEIAQVRRYLWAEAAIFALIPILAAAMARGYGSVG